MQLFPELVAAIWIWFRPARLLANLPPFTHNSQLTFGGFMFAVRSRKFQLGLMFATALSASLLPGSGQAYTQDQQEACSGDAFRLCGSEIPDIDRVTMCMVRNKSQLSPGCRAFFKPEPELTPASAGRPLSIRPDGSRSTKSRKARRDDDD